MGCLRYQGHPRRAGGDTLTQAKNGADKALAGFKKVKPQVYAGLFPISSDDYESFRDALDKLSLNDASLFFEPESSTALGFGFRCGFLGMLHMEIIQERLEREYDLDLITTAPTVVYEIELTDGSTIHIDSPAQMPPSPASRRCASRSPSVISCCRRSTWAT